MIERLSESCSLCLSTPQQLLQRITSFVIGLSVLRIACAIIGLILLVNIRSLPLVWHLKVILPLGILRARYPILCLYHAITLQPSQTRHRAVIHQLESLCPIGINPFKFNVTVSSWASPDETDWFGHVSNSNYAKTRDVAISKFAAAFPTFIIIGGVVPLSSTHYQFLREIPRFSKYEVNLSIGAWDNKWLYLVCRFTSPLPSSRTKSATRPGPVHPGRATKSGKLESSDSSDTNDSDGALSSRIRYVESLNWKTNPQSLNCVAVSRVCFKIGRVTVPPTIILSCEGFCKPPSVGSYSQRSPPPHWAHSRALRNASDSLDAYRRFLAGGWRDVPKGDEWWAESLSGPIEEQRRTNLAKFETMDRAMVDCMEVWNHT